MANGAQKISNIQPATNRAVLQQSVPARAAKAKKRIKTIAKYILVLNWIIIIVLLGIIIYMFKNDQLRILLSIPGLYQTSTYNNITHSRNSLVKEVQDLQTKASDLQEKLDSEDVSFTEKLSAINEYITIENQIVEKQEQIISNDEKLVGLNLPKQLVEEIAEVYDKDKENLDTARKNLSVAEAQKEYIQLRVYKEDLDNCTASINFDASDEEISKAFDNCLQYAQSLVGGVKAVEEKYNIKLSKLSEYVQLLQELHTINRDYYNYLAAQNYTKSKELDAQFVETNEKLSNIDATEAWLELKERIVDPVASGQ